MALSASQLVMDDGQQFLAKVKTGGKERLRPSQIENRDYMVGGKRRRGEARERQVYTIHKSSSKQSLSTGRCDTSQSYTFHTFILHCIVGGAVKQKS